MNEIDSMPGVVSRQKGLRERNKLAKLARIKFAARNLFTSQGYDNTTTREIARVADVGLGTLFSYAADKRDLLFLIMNEELEAMTIDASEAISKFDGIDAQLTDFFAHHFHFFALQPPLSRLMLREQQFYADTTQAVRFLATRARAICWVEMAVEKAQASRELATTASASLIARVLFGVFQMELREWLVSEPLDVQRGVNSLRCSLDLVLQNLRKPQGKTGALDKG